MSLRQCTESRRALCIGLFLALVGCAGGPETRAPAEADPALATEAPILPPEAMTMYEQAAAIMAAGERVEAELRFQEFLLRYPQFPGAHVNMAILFAGRGDLAAAEASLEEALTLDGEHAVALNRLGMVLRRQGRFEEAEAAYLRALAARPNYALACYNLGVLYDLYFGRIGDALQYYERYQELAGEDATVARWIVDLERRLAATQRTANVTE